VLSTRISVTERGVPEPSAEEPRTEKRVAPDDRDNAYVCDPNGGRLLIVKDTFGPYGS